MNDFSADIQAYLKREKDAISSLEIGEINAFLNTLCKARDEGRQIFIMGNGGSAATASHFVCDFNKGVGTSGGGRLFKFICLNDNLPSLMAYANDESYDCIFVSALKNYFNKGDVVIGISGSGNSKNVIAAIEYANANGGVTIGITGYQGGKLRQIASQSVNARVDDMQISEDLHMILDHLCMSILCRRAK